ncbi:hypothetical protein [Abyssalbus ytuae]|uniref:Uncharacterized protein n=1 Tax=Abyssalbus ytuae TaxID=2926907 RepID=A0A9E7CUH1_9FLAO|nr:hypothetical protein [Abyssalbus ytuae]UOB18417.1 hypothetical protein MQE35_03795 [Abyssalbus ytuae]
MKKTEQEIREEYEKSIKEETAKNVKDILDRFKDGLSKEKKEELTVTFFHLPKKLQVGIKIQYAIEDLCLNDEREYSEWKAKHYPELVVKATKEKVKERGQKDIDSLSSYSASSHYLKEAQELIEKKESSVSELVEIFERDTKSEKNNSKVPGKDKLTTLSTPPSGIGKKYSSPDSERRSKVTELAKKFGGQKKPVMRRL